MENLIVIYDKKIEDKGRDSYIKAIKRQIPDAIVADIGELPDCTTSKMLVLKPMVEEEYEVFKTFLTFNPDHDVEGAASGKFTITAEAILETIWSEQGNDLRGKTVVIINQSDVLGRPLAKELIDIGANVISLNSSYPCIDNLLTMTDVDVLVSASGQDDFEMDRELTRMIDVKIDLSNDLEDPVKITQIPTIEVLKERLDK
ncbi:Bifunctional protein FolD protein [Peptoniphilus tyrrelliae]|nr:Bifunctional protein FolD protein [Peptoniphilus tyrrelliae]